MQRSVPNACELICGVTQTEALARPCMTASYSRVPNSSGTAQLQHLRCERARRTMLPPTVQTMCRKSVGDSANSCPFGRSAAHARQPLERPLPERCARNIAFHAVSAALLQRAGASPRQRWPAGARRWCCRVSRSDTWQSIWPSPPARSQDGPELRPLNGARQGCRLRTLAEVTDRLVSEASAGQEVRVRAAQPLRQCCRLSQL